jgi:two-component system, NarL family, sensor kinase
MKKKPALQHANIEQTGEQELFESPDYYRVLAHQLISGQERERCRLARELHNDFTQRLAALAIDVGRLEKEAAQMAVPLLTQISALKNSSVKLAEHADLFCRQLYPAILEDLGLVEAIWSECLAFQQREGTLVRFVHRAVPYDLPIEPAVCIYRLVQEALKNVSKHACATKVIISLVGKGDSLLVYIRDNGKGCDPQEIKKRNGTGFSSAFERVSLLQGTVHVSTPLRSGLQIKAHIPLRPAL